MKIINYDEISLSNQQQNDNIAKKFINTLEKATGTKVLNTQSDYNSLSDFSFKIMNNSDTENSITTIYLTEEQMEIIINEMKSLVNEI